MKEGLVEVRATNLRPLDAEQEELQGKTRQNPAYNDSLKGAPTFGDS